MAKIKIEKIVGAVKDLNKVLGLEPPIPTKDVKEKELVTALSEVVDMIDETDEIKDSTREVLVQLGFIQPDVEDVEDDEFEEQEEEEGIEDITPTPPTLDELMDLIAECGSTKELKELMKSESELFEGFTPSAKVKNVIDLRTAMLDFLEKEDVEELEEEEGKKEEEEKVEKVKETVKKEVKEKVKETVKKEVKEKVKEKVKETGKLTLLEAFHTILNNKKQVTLDEFSEELMKIRPTTNVGHGKNFISASLQLLVKFDVVSLDGRNYKLND